MSNSRQSSPQYQPVEPVGYTVYPQIVQVPMEPTILVTTSPEEYMMFSDQIKADERGAHMAPMVKASIIARLRALADVLEAQSDE